MCTNACVCSHTQINIYINTNTHVRDINIYINTREVYIAVYINSHCWPNYMYVQTFDKTSAAIIATKVSVHKRKAGTPNSLYISTTRIIGKKNIPLT